ncbi:MAG: hypothetical protein UH080_03345 [Ruminococcus sp.]|nr:hypothetical protein [Ruminococcus sp.]
MFRKSLALILVAVSACCAFAGCSENSENTTSAITEDTTEETTITPDTEKAPDTAAPVQKIEGIELKAEYDSENKNIHITVENHTEADVVQDSLSYNYYKVNGDDIILLGNSLNHYSTGAYVMPETFHDKFEIDYNTDAFLDADFSKDKFIIKGTFKHYKDVEFKKAQDTDFYIPQIDEKSEFTSVILTGEITLKEV